MNTDLLMMNWNRNTNEPARCRGFRHSLVIREFECGLLYRYGRFQGRLEAGRHVRWGFGYALATVDLRKQTFAVGGQEVLSADNVGLKVSVSVTVHVADPLKAKHEGQAALERARGESAALRNLATAARLLESNPALQNLRLMQAIGVPGNTLVMGLPAGFVPLSVGKPAHDGSDAKETSVGEA